jgi:hypothetical protein
VKVVLLFCLEIGPSSHYDRLIEPSGDINLVSSGKDISAALELAKPSRAKYLSSGFPREFTYLRDRLEASST